MSTYKFLVPAEHIMLENIYYLAVSEDVIKSVPVADTYDRYGQKCGHYNAGDHLSINTQEAADYANKIYNENREDYDDDTPPVQKYSVGDTVSAYDFADVFDALLESGQDVTLEQQYVDAIQYHDGHNFRTIILEDDAGDILDYQLLDDDELEDELNEAISLRQYIGEGGGFINYESEKYYINQSNWQGDFESYQISIKNNE